MFTFLNVILQTEYVVAAMFQNVDEPHYNCGPAFEHPWYIRYKSNEDIRRNY
jgi:hypothetical protein